MKELKSETEVSQFVANNERAVVRYSSQDAGPVEIDAHLERLAAATPHVAFGAAADAAQPAGAAPRVTSVPTTVFYHLGREAARVVGTRVTDLEREVTLLAARPRGAGVGAAAPAAAAPAAGEAPAEAPIPRGFTSLNDVVELSGAELLNVDADEPSAVVRSLLNAGGPARSDADDQLLLFLPLRNKVTVAKLLVRIPEDLGDGQAPTRAKVWASQPHALSFEDAAANKATYETEIAAPGPGGWTEIPLRYVLFQSVSSLLVFLTGPDEDTPTVLDKLVVVGRLGESRQAGKLQAEEDED